MRIKGWRLCAISAVVGLLSLAGSARAEDDQQERKWTYKGGIFGNIGWSGFYHGDDSKGSGPEFGTGFGVRPFSGKLKRFEFEGQFNRLSFCRSTAPESSSEGRASVFTGNVLYHFRPSAPVQPYIKGGVGLLDAHYTDRGVTEWIDPEGQLQRQPRSENTDGRKFAMLYGAGVKFALTPRLSIRPEVLYVNTVIGRGFNWEKVGLGVALGYHF